VQVGVVQLEVLVHLVMLEWVVLVVVVEHMLLNGFLQVI
jgi:hypothetical protein